MKRFLVLLLLIVAGLAPLPGQSITDIIVPQNIEGINGTNVNRLPFVFRVRLSGLLPGATYRYFNQIVISSDAATSNGSGNCIFALPSGNFVRTTGPSLSSAGNYSTLTTNGSGEYEGWFVSEPTGNARFVPGKFVFMRIALNDGGTGTTVATRLTTPDSVRVLKLDPAPGDSTATGLRCSATATPKNFVFLYDNPEGTGRPLSGVFVESDGTDNTLANSYTAFYANSVNTVNGAFGTLVPNALAGGVRRIEERSLADGSLVSTAIDSNGVWPSGTSTVNPAGGTTELVLASTDLLTYTLTVNAANGTVTKNPDQPGYQYGATVQLTPVADSGYHFQEWSGDVPGGQTTDNPLSVTMDQHRTITANFAINASVPTLSLPTVDSVGATTALLGATVTSDGNSTVTARGIVWSESSNPTTADHVESSAGTLGGYTVTVDSLPPGVLVHFRGFAVNSEGTGYSPEATFYTLAAEPVAHVTSFAATASSSSAIHLSWDGAAGAAGYLILIRTGGDPTGLPSDATSYTVGAVIGDGTIAALLMTGAAVSADIPSLSATTTYHFTIMPFAWDGAHAETYNYKTNGIIPAAQATTLVPLEIMPVILPQVIEGLNGTNSNRIPFAYRARLTGLTAGATYRYFNQVVTSADAPTTSGSGNCIFVVPSGSFVRTSSPGLTTDGTFGTFTADGAGTYEGWFVNEPTGNARFVPGRYVFMRVSLNDGAAGTTVAARVTLADSVRVVKLDPAAGDSTGTGLRGMSFAAPRDFVFVYDNTGATGRPVSGTFLESDGTDNSTSNNYASFYSSSVNGVDGAFGLVVPNVLPTGIRLVERRSLGDATVIATAEDADGVWPDGGSTVNPAGGAVEIVLSGTDVPLAQAFTLSTPAVDLGSVGVGLSGTGAVSVLNPGPLPLHVLSVTSDHLPVFTVSPETARAAGGSVLFTLTFNPSVVGPASGLIIFTHDGLGSPDSLYVTGTGVSVGPSPTFVTVAPETVIAKDPAKGKFWKPVKKFKGLNPNWANLLDETVAQGGFQPGSSESDSVGGMVIGISHMANIGGKWKVVKDSAKVRAWVRLTKWDFKKSMGKGYNALQKTLETKAGVHDLMPARGFDFTTDGKAKPILKQLTKLDPKKQDNILFAEMLALKVNIAASQLGKTPAGFGDLLYDRDTSMFDEQSVMQIAAGVDQMMTYWQLSTPTQFNDAYWTVHDINRAFVAPFDTASFDGAGLTLKGVTELDDVPFLKAPVPFHVTRVSPTTTAYESGEENDLEDDEWEDAGGQPVAAKLYQNYPNPFNPGTTIAFRLLEPSQVTVKVFDMLGREVAVLAAGEELEEGYNEVRFDAPNMASGVYFCRIDVQGLGDAALHSVATGKMILMK